MKEILLKGKLNLLHLFKNISIQFPLSCIFLTNLVQMMLIKTRVQMILTVLQRRKTSNYHYKNEYIFKVDSLKANWVLFQRDLNWAQWGSPLIKELEVRSLTEKNKKEPSRQKCTESVINWKNSGTVCWKAGNERKHWETGQKAYSGQFKDMFVIHWEMALWHRHTLCLKGMGELPVREELSSWWKEARRRLGFH